MKTATRLFALVGSALVLLMAGMSTAQAAQLPSLSWSPSTTPSAFAYTTIDAGTSSTQTFTLSNSGKSGTSALKVSLSGSTAFSITKNTCSGTSLGPKKSCTVTVQYAPSTAGQNDTATLTVVSNKPAARASHTLTGSSAAPVVVVNPTFQWTFLRRDELCDPSTEGCFCLDTSELLIGGLEPGADYGILRSHNGGEWGYGNTVTANQSGEVTSEEAWVCGSSVAFQVADTSGNILGTSPTFTNGS